MQRQQDHPAQYVKESVLLVLVWLVGSLGKTVSPLLIPEAELSV